MKRVYIIAFLLCVPASLHATTVVLDNSGLTIPLQGGQITSFTFNGDLAAQCVQNPSGTCEGMPQETSAEAVLSTSEAEVSVSASFQVTWAPAQGAELCLASSTPGIQGWAGTVAPAGGMKTVMATTEGTATLALKCFNVSGSAGPVAVTVIVGTASNPGTGGCALVKSEIVDPFQRSLFQPEGFTPFTKHWHHLFGPGAVYPSTVLSEPYPVGSYTYAGNRHTPAVTTRSKYMSIPIVGNGNSYKFDWIQAKPLQVYNYQPARQTDFKYVVLSTCPGDFRIPGDHQYTSPDPIHDPTFIKQCRNSGIAETGINYGPTGFGRCPVLPGRTYYLNIVHANVHDGLFPFETGCRDTSGAFCETSWRHLND